MSRSIFLFFHREWEGGSAEMQMKMSGWGGETEGGSSCMTSVKQSSVTHAEDLTCWQQWWGLGTDITHLLHMWADAYTCTKTHTHTYISLRLSLLHICSHTWEMQGRRCLRLGVKRKMVYSVCSLCKCIWLEDCQVTHQPNRKKNTWREGMKHQKQFSKVWLTMYFKI